ncbi:MAG: sensor histidine kinase, partial [Ferruginibacter sp.]
EGNQAKLELANDITEKIKAEENLQSSHNQLRELAKHLQTIRESERAHMSREIHDELGQQLTGLKMDISWIIKHIATPEDSIREKFKELISLVDKSVKTVRRLSTQLRPSILDDLGLVAAMEWQSEDFQKRTEISTTFISDIDDLVITPEISINIFRIYQESLTNVMRHANATKVNSALLYRNNSITLSIKDNGAGFDKNRIGAERTLGLLGMKERTLMMKGVYEISSEPGKGTSVIINVPIEN